MALHPGVVEADVGELGAVLGSGINILQELKNRRFEWISAEYFWLKMHFFLSQFWQNVCPFLGEVDGAASPEDLLLVEPVRHLRDNIKYFERNMMQCDTQTGLRTEEPTD